MNSETRIFFEDWLKIPSISVDGTDTFSSAAAERLRALGLKASPQHVIQSLDGISKRQFNVIGILGDSLVDLKTKKGILVCAPYDTHSGGLSSNWSLLNGTPNQARWHHDRLVGLGAAHGKLQFIALLKTLERWIERKLKKPLYIAGLCGSEFGGFGLKYLLESRALNPEKVFYLQGFPSNEILFHPGKGPVELEVLFQPVLKDTRGFTRHVRLSTFGKSASLFSSAENSINAIQNLLGLLLEATEQGFDLKLSSITGGDVYSLIADKASVEFYLTAHESEDFKRFFGDYIKTRENAKDYFIEMNYQDASGVQLLPEGTIELLAEIYRLPEYFQKTLLQKNWITQDVQSPLLQVHRLTSKPGKIHVSWSMIFLSRGDEEPWKKIIQAQLTDRLKHSRNLNIVWSKTRTVQPHGLIELNSTSPLYRLPITDSKQLETAGFETHVFGSSASEHSYGSPNEYITLAEIEKSMSWLEALLESETQ